MSARSSTADSPPPSMATTAVEATQGLPASVSPGSTLGDPRSNPAPHGEPADPTGDACLTCLRRAWLLETLSARLGYWRANPSGC